MSKQYQIQWSKCQKKIYVMTILRHDNHVLYFDLCKKKCNWIAHMIIFNLGCIFLHFLLLIYLEREDLITYVTSLVILMLDINFCGILLIAANVLPSYGILVTISCETGCCFRSCDVSTHIINTSSIVRLTSLKQD